MTGLDPDPRPRVSWLLATNRLFGERGRTMSRADFIRQARDAGLTLDAPRISRWEGGLHTVPERVVSGYEDVLGLRPDSLRSAVRLVRPAEAPPRDDDVPDGGRDLDAVFLRVSEGKATGSDWRHLAADLSRHDRIYLHPATWASLCDRFVTELTRASGDAFVQRFEAGTALMSDARSRRHFTMSIGRFVTDPHVQNVVPALWLLRDVDEEGAIALAERLLSGSSRMLRHGSVQVVASMLRRGLWSPPTEPLEASVVHGLVPFREAAHHVDSLDVAFHLPDDAFDRTVAATRDPAARRALERARRSAEFVEPRVAARVAGDVAARAEDALGLEHHEPDPMLRRLVREAMFHVHWERRLAAGQLIAHTPYAEGLSGALRTYLADDDPVVATAAWCALRCFARFPARGALAEWALSMPRTVVAARGLITAALFPGELPDAIALALRERAANDTSAAHRHAATFVLGMAQHPLLDQLQEVPETRAAARWWRRTGGLLEDAAAGQR